MFFFDIITCFDYMVSVPSIFVATQGTLLFIKMYLEVSKASLTRFNCDFEI